jgi:hypothetical protein
MRLLSKIEIGVAALNVFCGILALYGKNPLLAICNFGQVPVMLTLAYTGKDYK